MNVSRKFINIAQACVFVTQILTRFYSCTFAYWEQLGSFPLNFLKRTGNNCVVVSAFACSAETLFATKLFPIYFYDLRNAASLKRAEVNTFKTTAALKCVLLSTEALVCSRALRCTYVVCKQ